MSCRGRSMSDRLSQALALLAAYALASGCVPTALASVEIPAVFAQAETFRPRSNPSAKATDLSGTMGLLVRAGLLVIGTILAIAGSYFGLFSLMLRQGSWPLNAFAISSICGVSTFFVLLLALFWDQIQLPFGSGFVANLPRLIVIALMIVVDLVIWSYHRAQARKLRAGESFQ